MHGTATTDADILVRAEAFAAAPGLLALLAGDGRVVALSAGLRELLDEDATGRPLGVLCTPPTDVVDGTEALLASRWLRWSVRTVPSGGAVAVAVDITRERSLCADVDRAERHESVSRLAVGLVHDFNNLLTVMSGHASMLAREVLPSTAQDDVDAIVRACSSAAGLARQLLSFGATSGLEPSYVRPSVVLEGLAKMLTRALGGRVEVVLHIGSDAGVLIDRTQLEQVLVNLAFNARDAMPEGGQISLSTARVCGSGLSELLEIAVADRGEGIAPDLLDRIFEPFFTTKRDAGTGLGLSVARRIVRDAGGHMAVESEVGTGTCFRIRLPIAIAPTAHPPSRVASAEVSSEPLRVLVVEDDPGVRRALQRILGQAHDVVVADAVAQAKAMFHDGQFDILLTDQSLPDGRGTDLIRHCRGVEPQLGVVLATGDCTGDLVSGELPSEVVMVSKPFTQTTLEHAIGRAVAARA